MLVIIFRVLISILFMNSVCAACSINIVPNIAQLTVSSLSPGSLVYVQGYAKPGDGGEGFFLITNTNPGVNDGGFNISLNQNNTYAVRQCSEGYVTPEMFGALGDGITDDSQAFINAQLAKKPIRAMGKTYVMKNVTLSSNTTIEGVFNATVFQLNIAKGVQPFDMILRAMGSSPIENVQIRNIYFDGMSRENPIFDAQNHGIAIAGPHQNFTIEDCTLYNLIGDGIWVTYSGADPTTPLVPSQIKISNCFFNENGRQDISLIACEQCSVLGSVGDGVLTLESDSEYSTNRNHTITGNNFSKISLSTQNGFAGNPSNITVTGNHCNQIAEWGGWGDVITGNVVTELLTVFGSYYVEISGNFLNQVIFAPSIGTYIVNPLFTGNQISNSSESLTDAVFIADVTNGTFQGNKIYAPSSNATGFHISNSQNNSGTSLYFLNNDVVAGNYGMLINNVGEIGHSIVVNGGRYQGGGYSILKTSGVATSLGGVYLENFQFSGPLQINYSLQAVLKNLTVLSGSIGLSYNPSATLLTIYDLLIMTGSPLNIFFYGNTNLQGPLIISGLRSGNGNLASIDFYNSTTTAGAQIQISNLEVTQTVPPFLNVAGGLTIEAGSNFRVLGSSSISSELYNGTIWNSVGY